MTGGPPRAQSCDCEGGDAGGCKTVVAWAARLCADLLRPQAALARGLSDKVRLDG